MSTLRTKEDSLQHIAAIKDQLTEQLKIQMRKAFGLREDENPSLRTSICKWRLHQELIFYFSTQIGVY